MPDKEALSDIEINSRNLFWGGMAGTILLVVLVFTVGSHFSGSEQKTHPPSSEREEDSTIEPSLEEKIIKAARERNFSDLRSYLEDIPRAVNARDAESKETPLHYAVHYGDTQMCNELLKAGAKVNARDQHGRTPLYRAAEEGRMEIAELLLENGADVSIGNDFDETPFQRATYEKHKEMAELLLSHGADVNTRDSKGWTPLEWAIVNDEPEMARFLEKHGGKR